MNANFTFWFVPAAFVVLAATGLAMKTEPAMAQQAAEENEEIVVQAPFQRREIGRSGVTGAKIELIELRRKVSFADLDLRKQSDVAELEARIEATAKQTCKQLSGKFRLSSSDKVEDMRCVKDAVAGTEVQVEAAIAAAS